MSYQITFNDDGGVQVFIWKGGGESLSCSTTADKLAKVLPAEELDALRGRCAQFLDIVGAAPLKLKAVK